MGEGLLCNVIACLSNVQVCGVEIVFNDPSNVGLNEESILAYFLKLVAFVSQIAPILILGKDSSGSI